MDKSWIDLPRGCKSYYDGIESFINFVQENMNVTKHICPCKRCILSGPRIELSVMRRHLLDMGMLQSYRVWTMHGEIDVRGELESGLRTNDVQIGTNVSNDLTMEMLNDVFPLRDFPDRMADDIINHDYVQKKNAFENYCRLMDEAEKPIFEGSSETVLNAILTEMDLKVTNRWSDKSFDKHLERIQVVLPQVNNYPKSYAEIKKVLKKFGMGYETFHGCEYGCILYYKEYAHYDSCPVCCESRYVYMEGGSRVPKKVVRYFPITPRLQRLYTSDHIAKEMRWHGERLVGDGEFYRHPADGDAWKNFNIMFPEFANEIRNVRHGLATDGFNPFGMTSSSHSVWPIVVMPYNLPPSMCMRKEFNILAMLISGPKSPGKCLNVFMRPLIDELQTLWNEGIVTYDRHSKSCFTMRAVVMWTISDFPGLGMLGGVQTKGYKSCPICLDEIDVVRSNKRMSFQGHRRWLPHDHHWRAANNFNGQVEFRDKPMSLSEIEILAEIDRHAKHFKVLSLHPKLKGKQKSDRLCWTHKSIFYELPYWKYLTQPYSLDVMHIEKNVFDCVVGAVLSFEGKRHLWDIKSGSSSNGPAYTVSPVDKGHILEMLRDVKYPTGYAGTLKSKINLHDKKFVGLKTHDCHVMLERLIPVFIRPYLPTFVVNPIVCLCRWFQRLCCRELTRSDVLRLKDDIVLILCHFERIFPPTFFTIMVHLMIHLPDQVLLKGPVHYNWMYPIERQLGYYKKYVRNTRYPEGCICEQYLAQECVTYVKLYLDHNAPEQSIGERSYDTTLSGYLPTMKLEKNQIIVAHWCVLENSETAKQFLDYHRQIFENQYPQSDDGERIKHCIAYFKHWMTSLKGTADYDDYLYSLSQEPRGHKFYSQCEVNGVKFVTEDRDCKSRVSQNSGLMVETDDEKYFGVIEDIIELIYPNGVSIVIFKCRWFNENKGNVKRDHGLESVDTSQSWYEDTPFCLASMAKQVFYIDDPKLGDNWKVVNVVSQRGTFSANSLARENDAVNVAAYQEDALSNIPQVPIQTLYIDLGSLPRVDSDYNENDDVELLEDEDDNVDYEGEREEEEEDDDDYS